MNSFSPGPDGERGVNLPEQANALVELGLRTDLRISPHKRVSRHLTPGWSATRTLPILGG